MVTKTKKNPESRSQRYGKGTQGSFQPSLRQLRYFCAVAEERHFGHAAECCSVSQSTLSAGIQELESLLNASLVERNNRRVLLTALGESVHRRAQHIMLEVGELMAECEAHAVPLNSSLRLGVIPTIAPYSLPRLMQQLRASHPNLRLYIREDMSQPLVDALMAGELDLLLLALPFPAPKCHSMELFDDPFYLAVPPGHALYGRGSVSIEDVRGADLLLLEDGHCLRDHALDACKLDPRDLNIPYQATSLITIVQMVANGIGMTLLPRMAVDANILHDTVVRTIAFEEPDVVRRIGLMWRKTTPRREEFALFGRAIRGI